MAQLNRFLNVYTLDNPGAFISDNNCKIPLIAGKPLESTYYNVTRNSKRDSLKNSRIGQSAAKLLMNPLNSMEKVQRLSLTGVDFK